MPQCKLKDLPFRLGLSWLTSFLQKCLHGDKMGWQEIVKCVKYKFMAGSTYYFLSMSPLQACQLKRDTITYEEKEQQLVSDCVKELREWDAHEHSKVTYCIFSLECSFFKTLCVCVCLRVLVSGESNSQMVSLTDELSQKNEELLRHQEEIAQLLSQIVELQHRVKEVRRAGLIK